MKGSEKVWPWPRSSAGKKPGANLSTEFNGERFALISVRYLSEYLSISAAIPSASRSINMVLFSFLKMSKLTSMQNSFEIANLVLISNYHIHLGASTNLSSLSLRPPTCISCKSCFCVHKKSNCLRLSKQLQFADSKALVAEILPHFALVFSM